MMLNWSQAGSHNCPHIVYCKHGKLGRVVQTKQEYDQIKIMFIAAWWEGEKDRDVTKTSSHISSCVSVCLCVHVFLVWQSPNSITDSVCVLARPLKHTSASN